MSLLLAQNLISPIFRLVRTKIIKYFALFGKEYFTVRTSTTMGTYLVRGDFHLTDDGHDVFAHHLEAMFANTSRRVDDEHDVSATVTI